MEALDEISRLIRKVKRLLTLVEVNGLLDSSLDQDRVLENIMAISRQVRR